MKYIMIVIVLLGIFVWERQSLASYEEPQYKQVVKDGRFEIRTYQPVHIAQTTVQGSFTPALKIGFRRIANYIFGGNVEGKRAVVQGFGNVGAAAAYYLSQMGVKIVGIIDSESGVINEDGFSFKEVQDMFLKKKGIYRKEH